MDVQKHRNLILNLWEIQVFLPHCLAKIDRVSFGLLSMSEYEELTRIEPMMPRCAYLELRVHPVLKVSDQR